jgi:hypothetical protein
MYARKNIHLKGLKVIFREFRHFPVIFALRLG